MYRKLIKFGESTLVISLPKEWTLRHHLKKGDSVVCEEENDSLLLNPAGQVRNKEAPQEETRLHFASAEEFKHLLTAAYIRSYPLINVTYDKKNDITDIREGVNRFLALEIIQQTAKKVVIKDFLNVQDVDPNDTLRRIDLIIRAMMEDAIACMKGEDMAESVRQKEIDVNRLSNLMFKILTRALTAQGRRTLDLSIQDVFYLWEQILFLEKTADQIKRLVRYKDPLPKDTSLIVELLEKSSANYELAMRAHYKCNLEAALKMRMGRSAMYKSCDEVHAKLKGTNPVLFEKIKNLNSQIANIAANVLKLHPKLNLQQSH